MVIDQQISTSIKRSPLKITLAISLLAQLAVSPGLALGQTSASKQGAMSCPTFGKLPVGAAPDMQLIASAISAKNMMQVPTFGKLDSGASPESSASPDASPSSGAATTGSTATTDSGASPDASASSGASTSTDAAPSAAQPATPADVKPADLTPVSISDQSQTVSPSTTGGDSDGNNMLKTSVTRNELAPKGPIENADALGPMSIKQSVGDKILPKEDLLKKAEQINLLPVALQPDTDEEKDTEKFKFNAEQQEMADLWNATLGRSQDIQFVIQKLMPNNNNGKTAGILMRLISTTVFGGVGAGMMMMPNMGSQMAMSGGANMMAQALNQVQSGNAKKARLNETEAIMLYNIVRTTADKMVSDFRSYKSHVNQLKTATSDLEDMQNMLKDAKAGQDPAKQFEMEYTMRKAQRDVEVIADDVKRFRQSLVDLAGSDSVTKLDVQLGNEVIATTPAAETQAPVAQQQTEASPATAPAAQSETRMVIDAPASPKIKESVASSTKTTTTAPRTQKTKGSPASSTNTTAAAHSQKTKGSVASSTTSPAPSQKTKESVASSTTSTVHSQKPKESVASSTTSSGHSQMTKGTAKDPTKDSKMLGSKPGGPITQ